MLQEDVSLNEGKANMQQYYPVQVTPTPKNKPATASLVLSIISFGLLILVIPMVFIGGLLISCAGQSPQASGIDLDDPVALEEYIEESKRLGTAGMIVIIVPPVLTGIIAALGLIFGIIGVCKSYNRRRAVVGIVLSSIPFIISSVVFAFGLL